MSVLVHLTEGCIVCWWPRFSCAAGVWHNPSVRPSAPVCTTDAATALAAGKDSFTIIIIEIYKMLTFGV